MINEYWSAIKYTVIPLMLVQLSFSTLVFLVIFRNFQSWITFVWINIFFMKLCTYLKTPNIELPESEIKMSVASSRGLPHPRKCDYLLMVTIFQGRLILKELRYVGIDFDLCIIVMWLYKSRMISETADSSQPNWLSKPSSRKQFGLCSQ